MQLIDLFERHYQSVPAYQQAKSDFSDTTTRNAAMTGMIMFDKFMQENGFSKLGSGAFANVYERPGYPWVFKIFTRDPAYLEWLGYVTANRGNEHVPKLRGKPFKINNDTFAVRMEKLSPLPDNYHDDPLIDAVMWGGVPPTSQSKRTITDAGHTDLLSVLSAINNIAYGGNSHTKDYGADLHRFNVMLRGNTLVITDPVVDRTQFR
jgi:hypothetical protein